MKTPFVTRAGGTARRLLALAGLALLAGLGATPLAAQSTGTITGTVTSAEDGAPLAEAQVTVTGTALGARTGPDGRFTITGVRPGTYTVRAGRLGMASSAATVTVAAGQTATASFRLGAQALLLDSVVAVGYTTQNRRNVSDAVVSVPAEALQDRQVATVEEALRGRVAGVNITSSGEPGRASNVVVRGQNFLSAADPLYVVDGMYTRQNPNLNPEDIESVEVLKDASAAAQYGAQSANGVILIRTRRGRAGAPRVNVSSYYGYQNVPNRIDFVDANRWLELAREARLNSTNAQVRASASQPFTPTGTSDWQDAVLQQGNIQDHNLSVSGGTENASYLLGVGYFDQTGTVMNTGFERMSFRANSEIRFGRFKLGQNAALSRSNRDNIVGFPLIDAVILTPVLPVRDPANTSGYGYGYGVNNAFTASFGSNPVGALERETNRDVSNRVLGNLFGEAALFGGLRYRLNVGVDYEDLNWRQFIRVRQIRQNTTQSYNEGRDRRDNRLNLLAENLLMYEGATGDHELSAVAGVTEQINRFRRVEAYGTDFLNENITEIGAATENLDHDAFSIPSSLRGYLARASYAYDGRYLLTGTFRRDGSSRFGPGSKWGNFFSGSAGYVLSEEDFYQSIPLLGSQVDYLKLRASYGSLGNQDIGDFQYQARIIGNQSYPFPGEAPATGSTQIKLANPDIRWQDQTQMNFGADLALLDNALELNLDYYVSESDGILVNAPIPRSLGSGWTDDVDNTFNENTYPPTVNAGSVRNSGFELGARYTVARGDLELTAGANLTTIRNRVTSLGDGTQPLFAGFAGVSRTEVGGSIGEFYLVRTDGIFQSQAEVDAHSKNGVRIQPNARPGDIRYVDADGDGNIDNDDRQVAGSPIPELEGGFNLNGTFRRLSFGLALRGSYGAEVFNVARYWNERGDENHNFRTDYDPWRPDNTDTDDPRIVFGTEGVDNARANSDRWLEDGSFLRIQNLVVGYSIPESFTRRFGVGVGQGTRIYLNVQNLHTFTGYSNWDPEVLNSETGPATSRRTDPLARGIDDGRIYPNPRTITLGLDLNL